jgi:flagellar hook-associated protein 1 FlgK
MANYLSMLRSAATGLEVLQDSALASQNNVSNASTPGYAKQSATVVALPFNPDQGLVGGVRSGSLQSSRDEYAEQSVRQAQSSLSGSQATANQMSALESTFDLNDVTGIPARLNSLFTAFSSWSVAPLSTSEKENVISAAKDVATSFNQAAGALQQTAQNAEQRINSTLTQIDAIAERIRQHNYDIRNGDANNAGSDAKMHSDLEELSSYVNFQALWQSDGTVTVLIGNQTALVTGDQKFGFTVTADPTVPPPALAGATP